jgi:predicted RNase H-like HicB family nuclease
VELTVNVHEEDGMLWGEVEELPGCFASGRDLSELADAVKEAIQLYLAPAPGSPPSAPTATQIAGFRVEVDERQLEPA